MRKVFSTRIAAVVFVGSTAIGSAAGQSLPSEAPGYIPSFNWTGFYAGGHAGHARGDFDLAFPTTPDQKFDGWIGGAQLGFNYQTTLNVVFGVEADLSFGNLDDRVPDGNFIEQGTEIDAFGTARARVGYAFDRWLPYLTGGLAWAKGTTDETCPAGVQFGHCSRTGAYEQSDSFTTVGWTVGAGLEFAVTDNWSFKGEYLHMDFGSEDHDLGALASPREADLSVNVTRFGVNYRFGGE